MPFFLADVSPDDQFSRLRRASPNTATCWRPVTREGLLGLFALLLASGPRPKLNLDMRNDQPKPATPEPLGDRGRDRRQSSRLKLLGKALFQWESGDGRHEAEGITRNVSKSGTFIETQSQPPLRTSLRVIVTLGRAGREDPPAVGASSGAAATDSSESPWLTQPA